MTLDPVPKRSLTALYHYNLSMQYVVESEQNMMKLLLSIDFNLFFSLLISDFSKSQKRDFQKELNVHHELPEGLHEPDLLQLHHETGGSDVEESAAL